MDSSGVLRLGLKCIESVALFWMISPLLVIEFVRTHHNNIVNYTLTDKYRTRRLSYLHT